jgi:GLPGLI family protein
VYVIAFYNDQITTPGGPESFSGLPGMLLGIAIPRINTTWFATTLEVTPVTATDITPPSKGKKLTAVEFQKKLNEVMKDWGKYGKRKLLQVLI